MSFQSLHLGPVSIRAPPCEGATLKQLESEETQLFQSAPPRVRGRRWIVGRRRRGWRFNPRPPV